MCVETKLSPYLFLKFGVEKPHSAMTNQWRNAGIHSTFTQYKGVPIRVDFAGVADSGSGTFLNPGTGIRELKQVFPDPQTKLLVLRNNF
jgi:hypothetical protein